MGIGQDRAGENPQVQWVEGVPVAQAFDDPYFSLNDGLAETEHVFLAGNDLPARLIPGFHVAELGFGTGLNALALARLAQGMPGDGRIKMTSFEAFPMEPADMARALAAFDGLADLPASLLDGWPARQIAIGRLDLTVIVGDARETLRAWDGQADAWFLDGFSPAKNPELWGADLMAEVARHTRPGGTFATYTAAGHVRRALSEAGFDVTRAPGFGRKRHMSRGNLR
ncbi:FAD-dependent oxidoreductase [Jannaschia pagri]|uniref:FAD-dependent oxidoreductase n=1 Tax=Jannaschia pagri TaxID=2829797 RepID=A0ABQ4NI62_9RHOB|nr:MULTISPECIES: tRNA (5-methylaminomethyl-2-thiouridine)(34)-methyltransferase MnmD [unclassified Jannaschia]GIT89795.1 FAD-dependent oxidoreductase [Jannaschia sp. AI_61]GIT94097.1 FAD-dependent oxidoreductase [Jannaschia sp. AI_62]